MSEFAEWQSIAGWLGGTVAAVAVSPAFLTDHLALAATPAGIYRSTDGGRRWAWSGQGITEPVAVTVAFAPTRQPDPPKAFAATQGGRLFVAEDGGVQWRELTGWAGLGVITSLVISPNFAADQTLFVTTDAGVFRSQDGGQSWESSTFGLHDLQTLCLACPPDFTSHEEPATPHASRRNPHSTLWVGTAAGGFYRSRNAGRSWRDAGAGLPDDAIVALLVSPKFATDQTLYLGTETRGLYRSRDGGATWQLLYADLAAAGVTCLAAFSDQQLVLGTSTGLYWSADGGQSWQAANADDLVIISLAVAPDGTGLAATLENGIYRSSDGGQSWQAASTGLAAHAPPVVLPVSDHTLLMLDSNGQLAAAHTGQARPQLNLTTTPGPLVAIASALVDGMPTLFAATPDGLVYTTWQASELEWRAGPASKQIFPMIVATPASAPLWLCLGDQAGLLYRWDGAEQLQCINANPPWAGETLLTLAFALQDGTAQMLVAVTAQQEAATGHYRLQLWQSQDGGLDWENLAVLATEIPSVALAWPVDPQEAALFVATRHRVIKIFTEPASQELRSTQSFLESALNITALTASPTYASDHTLWAATTRGVYQSSDSGATWTKLGMGLDERSVVALLPPTPTQPLQAVTLGGEVWVLAGDQSVLQKFGD